MKHRHMTFLEVVIRLIASMVFVLISWATDIFLIYPVGVILLVTALSGYCPFNSVIDKMESKVTS